MQTVVEHLNKLDKFLAKFPLMIEFEKKTSVPKAYFVTGLGVVYMLLILLNVGGELLSNIIGFAYPAYASFQALETTSTDDDTHWLTYWTVFGFLNVAEFFSDYILYWIPLYYTLKTVLVLYLYLPQFQGANVLYIKFIRPYMMQNESIINDAINTMKGKVSDIGNSSAINSAKAKVDSATGSSFAKND